MKRFPFCLSLCRVLFSALLFIFYCIFISFLPLWRINVLCYYYYYSATKAFNKKNVVRNNLKVGWLTCTKAPTHIKRDYTHTLRTVFVLSSNGASRSTEMLTTRNGPLTPSTLWSTTTARTVILGLNCTVHAWVLWHASAFTIRPHQQGSYWMERLC